MLTIRLPFSFYCMLLLSAMFVSTCYWPPVPIDTPLVRPWADNITTFADALGHLMPDLSPEDIPATIPVADRCWCDLHRRLCRLRLRRERERNRRCHQGQQHRQAGRAGRLPRQGWQEEPRDVLSAFSSRRPPGEPQSYPRLDPGAPP